MGTKQPRRWALSGALAVSAHALLWGCENRRTEDGPSNDAKSAPSSAHLPPAPPNAAPESVNHAELAQRLARDLIIVDGHIDLPYRLEMSSVDGRATEDVAQRTASGSFDYERARAGGLDAAFMSIYVAPSYQTSGGARAKADRLIDGVERLARAHPERFALAKSPDDVRQNAKHGRVSLALGIENGAALEGRLEALSHFRERGVSYVTLTHIRDNALADSANDERRTHGGLSALGKRAIAEMNRLGILVDISHASDEAFFQALAQSRVPVIASHSSVRHFVPGYRRNLSDAMLDELGRRGGVLMINFGSAFLRPDSRERSDARMRAAASFAQREGLNRENKADKKRIEAHAESAVPMIYASVADVADHIDYVKRRIGIEHIGLGSDFEGVGDSLPRGLEDVAGYPNLLRVLLERGYGEREIELICSGNVLRVWQAALDHAKASAD